MRTRPAGTVAQLRLTLLTAVRGLARLPADLWRGWRNRDAQIADMLHQHRAALAREWYEAILAATPPPEGDCRTENCVECAITDWRRDQARFDAGLVLRFGRTVPRNL